jgi:serine protease Do
MTDKTPNLFSRLPKPTPRQRRAIAMGSAAVLVVVGLGAFGFLPQVRQVAAKDGQLILAANETRTTPRMLEGTAPFSFADLVERVSPAVVSITSETMTSDNDQDDDGVPDNIPAPFRDLFNQFNQGRPAQPHKAISAGSGFIIDKAGFVVTNNHVIDASKKITVTLPDKRVFTAKLIGTDPATDIALLKIASDKPLPTVEFGNDRALRVGDWVVAVGNPFGLSNSVTAGIVSSLGRDIGGGSAYNDFIQIDAPINRGNSGGPTFDLRGQVIGMNSMIFSPSGGSVGIGFAIPATTIHDVVAQLKEHGRVSRGYLGVNIQTVTPEIATSMGLKDGSKGALVAEVVPNGPAAKAGFEQGDIVTAINGQEVEDSRDLTRKVALVAAGQSAVLTVNRQGKPLQLRVTIGNRPDDKVAAAQPAPQGGPVPSAASAMGLGLAPLTPEARRTYNLAETVTGAVITKVDPDSDAADKGLSPGDVVLRIGNRVVKTPQDVQAGVSEAQKGGRKSVLLLVARSSGGTGFVAVDIST